MPGFRKLDDNEAVPYIYSCFTEKQAKNKETPVFEKSGQEGG